MPPDMILPIRLAHCSGVLLALCRLASAEANCAHGPSHVQMIQIPDARVLGRTRLVERPSSIPSSSTS